MIKVGTNTNMLDADALGNVVDMIQHVAEINVFKQLADVSQECRFTPDLYFPVQFERIKIILVDAGVTSTSRIARSS